MSVKVRLSQWFFTIAGILAVILIAILVVMSFNHNYTFELMQECLDHDGSWINVAAYGQGCLTPSMIQFLNQSMNMTLWKPAQNMSISGELQ